MRNILLAGIGQNVSIAGHTASMLSPAPSSPALKAQTNSIERADAH